MQLEIRLGISTQLMMPSYKRFSRLAEVRHAAALMAFLSICAVAISSQQPASQATAPTPNSDQVKPDAGGDESGKKISGLAVITKAETVRGEPVFHADGYQIRVAPSAATNFYGAIKGVTGAGPNTWIRFEGVRDQDGVVTATKVGIFPSGTRKALTKMGSKKPIKAPEYQLVTKDSTIDANGKIVGERRKLRYSDAEGSCGWHWIPGDADLQTRVERVGLSVVPAYQKQLEKDDPARIPFRFYAVTIEKVRSVMGCERGLVLVPKTVVDRLQNDDQLAAVLADGVAFHLKRQLSTFTATDAAGIATLALEPIPVAYFGAYAATLAINHSEMAQFERSIERTALQLVADAGYDPWQAPEAWRLLAPKEMPKDPTSLEYTNEGKYQLKFLNQQYKRGTDTSSAGVESR